jgi:hypothetical protein
VRLTLASVMSWPWPARVRGSVEPAREGRHAACGPFTDGSGALYIYETGSLAAAEEIVAADPYQIGGVFADCRLSPWEIIKANPVLIPATR